jgi:membrane protein DedA with SNARE-associated domain/rhodanese-related sulfurtransferase
MTYVLLALTAFGAQALLVVPVVPLLLSAGVLASQGEMDPVLTVLALTAGVVPGDTVWFALGRLRGTSILSRVCRIAMEPTSCMRRSQDFLARHGARALMVGKFIPGLSTVALPMAGVYGMKTRRFLAYDTLGVLAWAGVYVTIGYQSARQLTAAVDTGPSSGLVAALVIGTIAIYLAWRYLRRRWHVRQVRIGRIDVDTLQRKLIEEEPVVVLDLRHALDVEADPFMIPGALYIPAEDLERRHREIPRASEIVVYCTCPEEDTSVSAAVRLRRRGFRRVRVLRGGFGAWRARGYPIEFRGPTAGPDDRILNAA